MELWDVYDRERMRTGKTVPRGGPLLENEFHLSVHVCIFNSRGEMLIQQRQPFKEDWPSMWDFSAGGCSVAGETSAQAVQRELFEELGIKADFSAQRPSFTINFRRGFDDYYIMNEEIDIRQLCLQPEEVLGVKWAKKEEILSLIREEKFIPYIPGLVEMIFDIRDFPGARDDAKKPEYHK